MKKLFTKFHEIIMYLIFGVLTTVVSWLTYALFTKVIPVISFWGITIENTTTANVLSWICAVVFAYITNKLWVFSSKSWRVSVAFKEFVMFVSSRLLTGVIEWVGLPLLIMLGINQTILGVEGMWAKIIVSVLVVILNYVFSKLFIFKNKRKDKNYDNKNAEEIVEEIYNDIHNK